MKTTYRIPGVPSACLFLCGALFTGCLSPKHLQPVANQNRANIEALSQNALTCLALYETQFSASVESLLILRISGINSSLIGAVGPPQLSPGTATGWESLLANKPAYAHRWQEVRAALAQNPDESVKRQLRARHGWIYQTVADPDFTPQRTLVYWKRFFDEGIRYPDGNLAEHAGFLRQVLKRGKGLAQLPNPRLFV